MAAALRTPEIRVFPNADALIRAAARTFVRLAKQAVRAKDSFAVALSGGSTPKSLYKLLAGDATFRTTAPWAQTHFFWGDERHVSPDHEDSNYRMAHESMLSRLPVPSANIHRIKGEMENARQGADDYEQRLREFFRPESGGLPRFDLVLLGMGPDGHTASLFPESIALSEALRLTVAYRVEKLNADRITLTAPVFNRAASVIFLVSGEEKAAMLRTVLQGPSQPQRFPAQLIRPTAGTLTWLVDSAAAGRLG